MEPVDRSPPQQIAKSLKSQEKAIDQRIKSLKRTFLGSIRHRGTIKRLETEKQFVTTQKGKLSRTDSKMSQIFSSSQHRSYLTNKREKRSGQIDTLSKKRFAKFSKRGTKSRLKREVKALKRLEQRAVFGNNKISNQKFTSLLPKDQDFSEEDFFTLRSFIKEVEENESEYTMGFVSEMLSYLRPSTDKKMTSVDFDTEVNQMWSTLLSTNIGKSFEKNMKEHSSQTIEIPSAKPHSDKAAPGKVAEELNKSAGFTISETERLRFYPQESVTYKSNPKATKQNAEHIVKGTLAHEKLTNGKWQQTGIVAPSIANALWEPESGYKIEHTLDLE